MDTSISPSPRLHTADAALGILRHGTAEVRGLFRLGSNDTFLCDMHSDLGSLSAVYKPVRGERPLWDFPAGSLGKREAAAFETACLLGWDFVPPTVFRADGPLGAGSFQEFLDLDLEQNYFLLRGQDPDVLRRVAVFDILINNADRKAMHVVRDTSGAVWLIDHGVCFHEEWKLRTVIWDFAGEILPDDIQKVLAGVLEPVPDARTHPQNRLDAALGPYLSPLEIAAVRSRIALLLNTRQFPLPGPGRSIPWPVWA
jgi:uncharacterized repeat protein (TIGR03843 family)